MNTHPPLDSGQEFLDRAYVLEVHPFVRASVVVRRCMWGSISPGMTRPYPIPSGSSRFGCFRRTECRVPGVQDAALLDDEGLD